MSQQRPRLHPSVSQPPLLSTVTSTLSLSPLVLSLYLNITPNLAGVASRHSNRTVQSPRGLWLNLFKPKLNCVHAPCLCGRSHDALRIWVEGLAAAFVSLLQISAVMKCIWDGMLRSSMIELSLCVTSQNNSLNST